MILRILGCLLLVAAALKLHGLAIEPIGGGSFSQPWLQTVIVEWEIILGAWLMSGTHRLLASIVAMATFVIFAAASFWQGWIGQSSCGCFGAIQVNPWLSFSIDIVALLLLMVSARRERREPTNTLHPPKVLRVVGVGACGVFAILGVLTAIATVIFGSPQAGLAYLRGERLSVQPRFVDVGEGGLGETREVAVLLHNWTDRPIRILGGTSDCSCVVTKDLPINVEPGETRFLTVSVVLNGAPGDFSRLALLFTDDEASHVVPFRLSGRIVSHGDNASTPRLDDSTASND